MILISFKLHFTNVERPESISLILSIIFHLGTKENINEPKNLTDTIREVLTKAKQLACEMTQKKEKTNTTDASTAGDSSNKKESSDVDKETTQKKKKAKTTDASAAGDSSNKKDSADAEKKRDKI